MGKNFQENLWVSFLPGHIMVHLPKQRKMYCLSCKGHKNFKCALYKPGAASIFKQGKRRYDGKQRGYGGQTKPIFKKKAKTTKKIQVRCKCSGCGWMCQQTFKRAKTVEFISDGQRRKGQKANKIF